jgi:hypothetical protein
MSAITVSRVGQVNQAGAVDALFLKKFAGEVLVAFERKQIMMDKHLVRPLSDAKEAQFPATGRILAKYHDGDGSELDADKISHAEITVAADKKLVAVTSISEIDDVLNHYEARSIYTEEMGKEMARVYDLHVMIEGIKGARSAATITGFPGGTQILNDKFKNTGVGPGALTDAEVAQALVDAIYQAAEQLDNNYAPDGRWCALRPQEYNILVKEMQTNGFSAIHGDLKGDGSLAKGVVRELAGVQIVKTTELPKTNVGAAGLFQFHGGDYSKTVGLIWAMDSIASVKWLDLQMEAEWFLRNQAWMFLAKYIVGHKYLRPEGLVELSLDTLTV